MPATTDTTVNEYTIEAHKLRKGDVLTGTIDEYSRTVDRIETGTSKTKVWVEDQTKQGPTYYVDSDDMFVVQRTEATKAAWALRMLESAEQGIVRDAFNDIGSMYAATEKMRERMDKGQHALDWGLLTTLVSCQGEANAWWEFIRTAQNVGSVSEAAMIINDEFRNDLLDTAPSQSTNPANNLLDAETREAKRHILMHNYNLHAIIDAVNTLNETKGS